ncbi:uncharacterized protein A1O5_10644 [Cladophialophora psammophila CBS 110553]|uniref:Circumsporozoite protein n=1 Tax=Cladophialophora psammophila CBS 110553 TaxID=1182543 RepID=W9WM01_9EURO|nr:uncharacterized protein A1O5_10644 [Cladophialophora psammophila CBS 110553]EXJ66030.1 hypothetical protein A1O5_10644 [Cladophialophora psammophila CBS 110553]
MLFKTVALATLLAVAHARFNQEPIPIPAIAAVQGGAPGVAPTIAGAAISDLLAAANACDKLKRGDQIIAELGTGADAVAAAIGIVAAEKNFNPFVQSIPTICDDPSLPATDVLRGITPLIDPAVVGSDIANALSAKTKVTPLDATGKSVADLLAENGFTNFTAQSAAGATSAAPAASVSAGADASTTTALTTTALTTTALATTAAANVCGTVAASNATSAAADSATSTTSAAVETSTAAADTTGNATQASTVSGADFGLCVPTMKFEGGLGGRPATEFTFLPIDPLCAQGQQEALNPNIITNRICDQLTNVCQANDAAKTLCRSVQAQIQALGTRDKSTVDTWNANLGFAGTVTNPDGGPAEPPAKMRVVRSYRGY